MDSPTPRSRRCPKGALIADPLNGKREGWPAPGPEAIAYLAGKGIRCVATDAPSLGGVDPKTARLATYWMLGTKNMVGVEFLTSVGKLPAGAYFIFAPLRIQGCHGGPGRRDCLILVPSGRELRWDGLSNSNRGTTTHRLSVMARRI